MYFFCHSTKYVFAKKAVPFPIRNDCEPEPYFEQHQINCLLHLFIVFADSEISFAVISWNHRHSSIPAIICQDFVRHVSRGCQR
jgi:hypothetical protein